MFTVIVVEPPRGPGIVPVPDTDVTGPVDGLIVKPPEVSDPESV
jgi:hypothetical protein